MDFVDSRRSTRIIQYVPFIKWGYSTISTKSVTRRRHRHILAPLVRLMAIAGFPTNAFLPSRSPPSRAFPKVTLSPRLRLPPNHAFPSHAFLPVTFSSQSRFNFPSQVPPSSYTSHTSHTSRPSSLFGQYNNIDISF